MLIKITDKNTFLTLLVFVIFTSTIIFSIFTYHGYTGTENYLPINHLISELGNRIKSPFYYIFNFGIILSGILLLIITYFSKINFSTGKLCHTISCYALIGVGVFPEHGNIKLHLLVASIFFVFSGLAVAIITYEYFKFINKPKRKIIIALGIITFLTFLIMIALPKPLLAEFITQKEKFMRPKLWILAIVEWLYVCFYVFWFSLLQVSQSKSNF